MQECDSDTQAHITKSPNETSSHLLRLPNFVLDVLNKNIPRNRVVVKDALSLLLPTLETNGINFVWLSVLFSSSGYSCQAKMIVLG